MGDTTAGSGKTQRKRGLTWALWGIIALGFTFWIVSPGPSLERVGPDSDPVQAMSAVGAATAHERMVSGLAEALQSHPHFAGSRVVEYERNGFPSRFLIARKAHDNRGLQRYARLEPTGRSRDLFVRGPYKSWPSEYQNHGKPVAFNTDFLIHLDPSSDGQTRIEVIEYSPSVTVGRKYRLCGPHLVPTVSPDRRPVAPTTLDRQEMLQVVVEVVELRPPR